VSVGVQVGSVSGVVSYDHYSVSGALACNCGTSGSVSVTIVGVGFGNVVRSVGMRIGGTSCEGTAWVSSSSLLCKVGAGALSGHGLCASVGLQVGSLSELVSYDGASMSGAVWCNAGTSGSVSVTVVGSGFGGAARSWSVRLGGTSCEGTGWVSSSAMVCKAGAGLSAGRGLCVSVGLRVGSVSGLVSFDVISVSGVVSSNGGGSGSVSVTIVGGGFGGFAASGVARVGGTSCEGSSWVSETSLLCKVGAGVSEGRGVCVSIGLQVGSVSGLVSFDGASVSGVVLCNAGSSGSVSVTVVGSGFWHSDSI